VKRGHIELTAYRLSGRDEITSYTVSVSPRITENRNIGSTLHQGLELGAEWQFLDSLKLYASATVARHEYENYQPGVGENYSGKTMPGAPRHFGLVALDWKGSGNVTLTPEVQYLGAYWMNDANSVRYPGHTLLNLRARWQQEKLEIYGQFLNAANRHYAQSASSSYKTGVYSPDTQNSYTPGDPRTALLGFNYALSF
jgi:outer membrane receptor protein involved in Fe transport